MHFQPPTLTEQEVGTVEACVEFLRSWISFEYRDEKYIETAWRIATKLEAIAGRAYNASMIEPDKSPSERAVE